jgi:shikimate kinase
VTVPENVRLMKESGTVVLLTASPEEILARVRGSDERPLLNGHMDADYIRGMLQKRERFYLEAADMTVSTDGKETGRIVPEILRQLEQTTTGN